jgi:hypothetical protein
MIEHWERMTVRISSSQVSMNAGRVFSREQESSEKLRVWVGDEPPESSTTAANARPSAALASEARRLAGGTINFGGTAAQLSGSTSDFDIDADGVADQVHLPQPGSGFLALDVNGDEKINDGSELFGPSTGNGFIELSRYDTDGNGWIDEANPVFKNFLIWSRDLNGNDQVARLSDKDVGAIYTGKTETPFAMKDGSNTLVGEVVSTGVYLDESGKAGTVQQINLTA